MNKELFGLREKIAAATSEQEIVNFLKTGNTYEFASPRTRISWKNTAYRVINKLKNTQSVEEVNNTDKKVLKSKNKKVKK